MMIVNFDKDNTIEQILSFLSKREIAVDTILDFTYNISKENSKHIKVIYPKDLDNDLTIQKNAIESYVERVSKINQVTLSDGRKIRDILFSDFPVYWLTNISLKHAQFSIVKNFFYLSELFKDGKIAADVSPAMIIPSSEYHFNEAFKKYLQDHLKIKSFSYCLGNPEPAYLKWSMPGFFKSSLKKYRLALKIKEQTLSGVDPKETQTSIFTYPVATWNYSTSKDYIFSELNDLIREETTSDYIPVFSSLDDFIALPKWDNNWNVNMLRAFPSYFDFIKFCRAHYKFIRGLSSLEIKSGSENADFIDKKILISELQYLAYINFGLVFYSKWLTNYFDTLKQTKKTLVYQDEFYHSGRVISFSKQNSKNKNIESIGVQHGLFYTGHTVYSIRNEEIKGKNAMPVPDKFVVWGEWFKNYFLKQNDMESGSVPVGGNLKYIQRIKDKRNIVPKSGKVILWCTTLESDTSQMFEILKSTIKQQNEYKLLIRCHPQWPLEEKIKIWMDSIVLKKYEFSTSKNIFEDIDKCSLMVTSNASTSFLDGLIGNVPVINIVLPDYYVEDFSLSNLYCVKNEKEFDEAFKSIENEVGNIKETDLSNFISTTVNLKQVFSLK